jgi:hypothetical protein
MNTKRASTCRQPDALDDADLAWLYLPKLFVIIRHHRPITIQPVCYSFPVFMSWSLQVHSCLVAKP